MDIHQINTLLTEYVNAHRQVSEARERYDLAYQEWRDSNQHALALKDATSRMEKFDQQWESLEAEITTYYEKQYGDEIHIVWVDYLTADGFTVYVENTDNGEAGSDVREFKVKWEDYFRECGR